MAEYPDRSQLQQIIAGITEGIILIEPDHVITYEEAALDMHGVKDLDELGRTVEAYRQNFIIRDHTKQMIEEGRSPIDRVAAGEIFVEVVVELAHRDRPSVDRIHRIRSLVGYDGEQRSRLPRPCHRGHFSAVGGGGAVRAHVCGQPRSGRHPAF